MSLAHKKFLADVAAVYTGDSTKGSFGSGRLIAPGLILTAGHVVDYPARETPLRTGWKVSLIRNRNSDGSWAASAHQAELVWRGLDGLDLALLQLTDGKQLEPEVKPEFASYELVGAIDEVDAAGFPNAWGTIEEAARDYTVRGDLRIASQNGPYAWCLRPADRPDDPVGWKGMSGAAVCRLGSDGKLSLFGAVQEVPANFSGGLLEVARLSNAFEDLEFCRHLQTALNRVPKIVPFYFERGDATQPRAATAQSAYFQRNDDDPLFAIKERQEVSGKTSNQYSELTSENKHWDVLMEQDRRFLAKADEDLFYSCFPYPNCIEDHVDEINWLTEGIAGRQHLNDFKRYVDDHVDIAETNTIEGASRIGDAAARAFRNIRISCPTASCASLLMGAAAYELCPCVSILCDETDHERQISEALNANVEIAIFPNAAYFSSPRAAIRSRYILYSPLHSSKDSLYIKCDQSQLHAPKLRRIHIITDSSGVELQRLNEGFDWRNRFTYSSAHAPDFLYKAMDFGDAINTWNPIARKLVPFGFRPYDKGSHHTWFSIFLRHDLLRNKIVYDRQRHLLIRLLTASWFRVTESPSRALLRSSFRSKFVNKW
jgi:hypothetical protein